MDLIFFGRKSYKISLHYLTRGRVFNCRTNILFKLVIIYLQYIGYFGKAAILDFLQKHHIGAHKKHFDPKLIQESLFNYFIPQFLYPSGFE